MDTYASIVKVRGSAAELRSCVCFAQRPRRFDLSLTSLSVPAWLKASSRSIRVAPRRGRRWRCTAIVRTARIEQWSLSIVCVLLCLLLSSFPIKKSKTLLFVSTRSGHSTVAATRVCASAARRAAGPTRAADESKLGASTTVTVFVF